MTEHDLEQRAREWKEQFDDHAECPICGTACEMLYVDGPDDLEKMRREAWEQGRDDVAKETERYTAIGGWLESPRAVIAAIRSLTYDSAHKEKP